MTLNIDAELARLRSLAVRDLRLRYAEAYGESTKSGNRAWLIRRIAWRLQSLAHGDLTERARQRARDLANEADLRTTFPRERRPSPDLTTANSSADIDRRLPPAGTWLKRIYKGTSIFVEVTHDGFVYEGRRFKSLSAVAKAITGSHCNGYLFFKASLHGHSTDGGEA